jgi:diguanylate cyclase (GGDEF)-like protein
MKYDMLDAAPIAAMLAMETISEAFLLLDRDLGCLACNSSAKKLFPSLSNLQKGDAVYNAPDWPSQLSPDIFVEGEQQIDFERKVLGTERYYRATISSGDQTQFGSKRMLWSVLVQDVTESESFVKQLEDAAYTDQLTGLYNRRHFAEIATPLIRRAIRMGMPYYVLIADLDLFKRVNDEYGHLAGDEVLCSTARVLKSTIRSYDTLARWGGEEFIMLFTEPDETKLLNLAERIRKNIEAMEVVYMEHTIKITISSGIAQNDGECDMTELARRADEALYISKTSGRNQVTMWKK